MAYEKLLNISEDWLKYAIYVHLCGASKDETAKLKNAALADGKILNLMNDVISFHGMPVTNHKNPDLPVRKLLFLLDIGFDMDVPEINTAIDQILKHRDDNGVYQSVINIPKHFGGAGEDVFSWCLCDAPLLLLVLLKAGVDYSKHIKAGVEYLVSLSRDNGFPCAVSPELGKFRGPGSKGDCCPYATLIMADLLSHIPEYCNSSVAVASVETLLSLWKDSFEKHPYMFYMGTDFRKLKAPPCWYDIISVASVVSKYPFAAYDPRFLEMIALIKDRQDRDGLFTPESVYQKLKGWDFGQKKSPSPYLTYLCLLIFQRLE